VSRKLIPAREIPDIVPGDPTPLRHFKPQHRSKPAEETEMFVFASGKAAVVQEHILIGRITGLRVFRVPEFGTRASFRIEREGQCPIICSVAGDVARDFIALYCEGDMVAVSGLHEPRPSTASSKTPWVGRFRVCALCDAKPTQRRYRITADWN
jgi:hypothetical protein